MKVALFLDVDITLTEDYIQKGYASELGVEPDYKKLEDDFQAGVLPSTTFGAELTKLFATKQFSKDRADQLFERVKLRPYVDELFELQKLGVAIYLVSSGPNYYIEKLARKYGVPTERTKSSTYYFENNGVISRCNGVDANAKTQFVVHEKDKYDVTIGIGDSERHDAFVSVCTVGMLTKAQKGAAEDFIHVAHFQAVFLFVKNLLQERSNKLLGILKLALAFGFGAAATELIRLFALPNIDLIWDMIQSNVRPRVAIGLLVGVAIGLVAWILQKYLRIEGSSRAKHWFLWLLVMAVSGLTLFAALQFDTIVAAAVPIVVAFAELYYVVRSGK